MYDEKRISYTIRSRMELVSPAVVLEIWCWLLLLRVP